MPVKWWTAPGRRLATARRRQPRWPQLRARLAPDRTGPAPCPDFDVSALVDHLVGAGWRTVALGRGEAPTGGGEFPHVELDEAAEQLRRAGRLAEAGWCDDVRLATKVTMPWGEEYSGATLVDMYLAELAAHNWDLAIATGQLDRLDAALAATALEAARAMLEPEYRNAMGPGSPFADEIQPPDDAGDVERFAAFMGRQPRPASV